MSEVNGFKIANHPSRRLASSASICRYSLHVTYLHYSRGEQWEQLKHMSFGSGEQNDVSFARSIFRRNDGEPPVDIKGFTLPWILAQTHKIHSRTNDIDLNASALAKHEQSNHFSTFIPRFQRANSSNHIKLVTSAPFRRLTRYLRLYLLSMIYGTWILVHIMLFIQG